jgi:hypothetical protein
MMAARRPHGCVKDPAEFLSGLKAAGERWSPMQAARLVIGEAADSIRKEMGDEWLLVVMAAHLADARDQGEWSFAHTTMQAWLDYQQDLVDEAEYRRKIAEAAQDGMAEYCRVM